MFEYTQKPSRKGAKERKEKQEIELLLSFFALFAPLREARIHSFPRTACTNASKLATGVARSTP